MRVMLPILMSVHTIQTGEYAVGWNTKITPLGYKLLSLNAVMNGITPLQQASVCYNYMINMSTCPLLATLE